MSSTSPTPSTSSGMSWFQHKLRKKEVASQSSSLPPSPSLSVASSVVAPGVASRRSVSKSYEDLEAENEIRRGLVNELGSDLQDKDRIIERLQAQIKERNEQLEIERSTNTTLKRNQGFHTSLGQCGLDQEAPMKLNEQLEAEKAANVTLKMNQATNQVFLSNLFSELESMQGLQDGIVTNVDEIEGVRNQKTTGDEEEIGRLQHRIDELLTKAHKLEIKDEENTEEISKLQNRINELLTKIRNHDLMDEVTANTFAQKDNEIKALIALITSHEIEIEGLKEKLAIATIEASEKAAEMIAANNMNVNVRMQDMEDEIAFEQAITQDLEEKLAGMENLLFAVASERSSNQDLVNKCSSMEKQLASERSTNQTLAHKRSEIISKFHKQLEHAIETYEIERDVLSTRIHAEFEKRKQENQKHKAALQAKDDEIKALIRHVLEHRKIIKKLEKDKKILVIRTEVMVRELECSESMKHVEELHAEILRLKCLIKDLQFEILELQGVDDFYEDSELGDLAGTWMEGVAVEVACAESLGSRSVPSTFLYNDEDNTDSWPLSVSQADSNYTYMTEWSDIVEHIRPLLFPETEDKSQQAVEVEYSGKEP
ncbi:hypothetical protein K505DRAFT_334799 [Melanomma pulvis-pyrius CBS 109.77]|uniref:Uncharacterized protein n=1 Tax=Melanomma pulvis-pyrius CBS 109.77 TaxID=1314802 RepID=A0A6A6XK98_9PLEO|nr:hypothetical protein K505DRAFT_334799 [Melanomma pulvis-pyrius CBS 109.77]